ncbi:hypothetical protein BGZ95_010558 [Linnemannia exigua]|uniref:Uncharacterized protein n=1 Tax=Linnemannia exigua TaxID=604196 RepID=A0AAD4H5T9_9FUNG|nr:hypothetical protein BGZ95_010558 [Linnemannia exigua]
MSPSQAPENRRQFLQRHSRCSALSAVKPLSNLRRHLKNIHNMPPTMHPRRSDWDSIPNGRVKDDEDRKERLRKSKCLWARKYRLRRKVEVEVEEAALVLCMLSKAV